MNSVLLSTLFYPFETEFMFRALIAAILVGFTAPLIGTFVVQRKISLVGDGLGHVAAAGVGLALWMELTPQWIGLIATLLAAIIIELIFKVSKNADTALAIIFYSGIAASITFAGRSARQSQLQQYLFGSILTVTWEDIFLLALTCAIVSIVLIAISKILLGIALDESSAKIAGINVHLFRIILMCSVAFIVSFSMSITGLLLISAVMVVPVMSSRTIANNFRNAWIGATLFGLLGSIAGLVISRLFDLAPGGTIVLTHIFIFIMVVIMVRAKTLVRSINNKSRNGSR